MESKFFSTFDPTLPKNENFFADLERAFQIEPRIQLAGIELLPKIISSFTLDEKDRIRESFANDNHIDNKYVSAFFRVFEYIFSQLSDNKDLFGDSGESLFNDLQQLGFSLDDSTPEIRNVFINLVDLAKNDGRSLLMTLKAESGVLPTIWSFSSTVEIRGIITEPYNGAEKVDTYFPKFHSFVPISSVEIQLSSDKKVHLQLSLKDIDFLVDHLLVIKKELHALQAALSL